MQLSLLVGKSGVLAFTAPPPTAAEFSPFCNLEHECQNFSFFAALYYSTQG